MYKAFGMAIEEMFEETGGRWHPRAVNGKSLRIGEVILIVDTDTIVPDVSVAYMHFHSCLFLTPDVRCTGRAVYAILPWN